MKEKQFLDNILNCLPIRLPKHNIMKNRILHPEYMGYWEKDEESGLLGLSFWFENPVNGDDTEIDGIITDKFGISGVTGIYTDHKGHVGISFQRTEPKWEYAAGLWNPAFGIYKGEFDKNGTLKLQGRHNIEYDQLKMYDGMFKGIYENNINKFRQELIPEG